VAVLRVPDKDQALFEVDVAPGEVGDLGEAQPAVKGQSRFEGDRGKTSAGG